MASRGWCWLCFVIIVLNMCIDATPTVVTLMDDNFDEIVKDVSQHVFVKFYAPWCSHCNAIQPEWEKATRAIAAARPDVVLAEMDCEQYKDRAYREEVRSFPIFRLYSKFGKAGIPYKGDRTGEAMTRFVVNLARG